MNMRHVIALALCAGLTVPFGVASAAGDTPPDEVAEQERIRAQLELEPAARGGTADHDGPGLTGGPALTSESMVVILDPRFDVVDGRGDITNAAMSFTGDGRFVYGGVGVDIFANPLTDLAWTRGPSGPSWHVDTSGDGAVDHAIYMFSIMGQLAVGVHDIAADTLVCTDGLGQATRSSKIYSVLVDRSCLGNPTSFRFFTRMFYDGIAGVQIDRAPNSGWAGPVVLPGAAQPPPELPAPSPEPPAPAPQPSPTPPDPPKTEDVSLQTVDPRRVFDTRPSGVGAGSVTEVRVAGVGGVPGDASAVVLNVTAVGAGEAGYVSVFPCGSSVPSSSNLNFVVGQTVPNAVVAKVGSGGRVCLFSSAPVDLLVDVAAHVPAGSSLTPVDPMRVFDTRSGARPLAGSITEVSVIGLAGIPATARTVVLNVTAVGAGEAGYVSVFPCGSSVPSSSNLNFVVGQTVPNAVVAKVGSGGRVCLFSSASVDLLVDVAAYVP